MGLMVRNGKRRKMAGLSWRVGGRGERAIQAELSQPRAQNRFDERIAPMKAPSDKAIARHQTQQPRTWSDRGCCGAVAGLLWVYEGANERAWQGLSRGIKRPQHGRTAGAGDGGQVARLAVDKAHRQPGKCSAFHPVGGQPQLGGAGDAPCGQQAGQLL